MLLRSGGLYAIKLQLDGSSRLGPQWLVGAMYITYPQAKIIDLIGYDGYQVTITFRWDGPPGEINEGDRISPSIEGLAAPAESIPSGTVLSVMEISTAPETDDGLAGGATLLVACGILTATWLLSKRIKR